MNRELTGREKVMLLILSVLVMALGYYKLILEPSTIRWPPTGTAPSRSRRS